MIQDPRSAARDHLVARWAAYLETLREALDADAPADEDGAAHPDPEFTPADWAAAWEIPQ